MFKKYLTILIIVFVIIFGIFFVVYGEFDDSPGGQLIGLVMIVIGIISLVRGKRKN